ncbi:MAG: thioredoxin [Lachnospiraceae bacterium]|nr:thioredoxin [Lachnospiraceae bacterium]
MAIIKGNAVNFEAVGLNVEGPVLVVFWAEWCWPCQMIAPVLEQGSTEHPEYTICKVNVDEEPQLQQQYQVMNIPYLLVFKGGKVVNEMVGLQSKEDIVEMLKQV